MNYVVIGAGFGDEGKGLMTDALVRRTGAETVARFNGGAQAGHTVVHGFKSHVFGHVGAGTFAGADTYLGSRFIVNPMLLAREMQKLQKFAVKPYITAHKNSPVTTIYDMMLNNLIEEARGASRHGSCGVGINETVTRDEVYPIRLTQHFDDLAEMLTNIREKWVPARMAALGLTEISEHFESTMAANVEDVADKMRSDIFEHIDTILPPLLEGPVIFEGAQGLALDEFLGEFPHVTRSMTGLPYALTTAAELGLKELTPVYVTRAYSTRHGAGRLAYEGHPVQTSGKIPVDTTNIENVWQGTLRFAPLNLSLLREMISADWKRGVHVAQAVGVKLNTPKISVTCLDQIDDQAFMVMDHCRPWAIRTDAVSAKIIETVSEFTKFRFELLSESWGPTASDVRFSV